MKRTSGNWGLHEILVLQAFCFLSRMGTLLFTRFLLSPGSQLFPLFRTLFTAAGRLFLLPIALYYIILVHGHGYGAAGLKLGGTKSTAFLAARSALYLILFFVLFINIPQATGQAQPASFRPLVEITNMTTFSESLLYFAAIFLALLAPIFSDELYYRGLAYDFFRRKAGIVLGTLTGAFFYSVAQLNYNPQALLGYFTIGLVSSILYEASDSLLPGILFRTLIHSGLILYVWGWFF